MRTALALSIVPADYAPRRDPRRQQIEEAIAAALDTVHRLIAYLDTMDGDADLEPEEPETGAREWCGSGAHRFDVGAVA